MIVAPYEADAQLAYLSLHRIVDVIISEDSDNIPFGSQEVIFKLERDGSCQRLLLANIFINAIERFDCRGFTQEMIVVMCILSGCDYLVSLCCSSCLTLLTVSIGLSCERLWHQERAQACHSAQVSPQ